MKDDFLVLLLFIERKLIDIFSVYYIIDDFASIKFYRLWFK